MGTTLGRRGYGMDNVRMKVGMGDGSEYVNK